MQGKHLTEKERFYIESGVVKVSTRLLSPESLLCLAQLSAENSDAIPTKLSMVSQDFIRQELSTHSSPEIISWRLYLEFGISISNNTLYRYILQEKQAGGELYQ